MSDHYDTLGVSRAAPDEVIRAAYKARIRTAHPDAGGDAQDAQRVNEAYAVLSDPARRADYDRSTAPAPAPAAPPATAPAAAPATAPPAAPREVIEITRWWKRRPSVIAISLWSVLAAATVTVAGYASAEWVFPIAAAIAAAFIVRAITLSQWKSAVLLGALLVVGALAVSGLLITAPVLAVASATVGLVLRRMMSDELDELVLDRAAQFWHLLACAPDADAWFVENVAVDGARTTALLQHLDSDARSTRTLWGDIAQGSYLLLSDADEPIMSVPFEVMERAAKLAKRRPPRM